MKVTIETTVLVVVLNYRTPQMTVRAAEAALADMPAGAEIVIVDNASGDDSLSVIETAVREQGWDRDNRVRVIASPQNGGFGAGNNIGIRAGLSDGSTPDYLYIVNSDAFADPGCVGTLVAFLDAHPEAGIAGSHVRGEDGVDHTTAFRFPSIAGEFEGTARLGIVSRLLRGAIVAPPLPTRTAQVDWVAGASMLLRSDMLDEIGLFDEEYFLYFDETDLCLRAARAGWLCYYVPDSRVVHIGSVSTGMKQWQRMPSYWFDSRRRYFTRNHGRLYAAAALGAHIAGVWLYRLRCLAKGDTPRDPPRYLRDLIAHAVKRRRPAAPPPLARRITEDRP
jgi:hypothetical protein